MIGGSLPEVGIRQFSVAPDELAVSQPGGFWEVKIGVRAVQAPSFVLLADPFSCDAMKLLSEFDRTYPARPVIGGLASGGEGPGQHGLFLNDHVLNEGAVGVALTGAIRIQTLVSQGCRPIGRPFIITRGEGNVIVELAGQPAVKVAHRVLAALPAADQTLARQALFIGLAMNEMKQEFRRGDFLIRNLVGIDGSSGAIVIGDQIQVGQTVQFQLRDASASAEDLQTLLKESAAQSQGEPAGALLFSCTGRGARLYGKPHHDLQTIRELRGLFPIGGFFCNGEIGPVGGRTFLHGYTSSVGFFWPAGESPADGSP